VSVSELDGETKLVLLTLSLFFARAGAVTLASVKKEEFLGELAGRCRMPAGKVETRLGKAVEGGYLMIRRRRGPDGKYEIFEYVPVRPSHVAGPWDTTTSKGQTFVASSESFLDDVIAALRTDTRERGLQPTFMESQASANESPSQQTVVTPSGTTGSR